MTGVDILSDEEFLKEVNVSELEKVLAKFFELYDEEIIVMDFESSGVRLSLPSKEIADLAEETKVNEEKVRFLFSGIMGCIYNIIHKPEELHETKKLDKELREKSKQIYTSVKKELEKRPYIEQKVKLRTFCKHGYLENIEWEANLKMFQNNLQKVQFPVSVIKLQISQPLSISPGQQTAPESKTIVFEVNLEDVESLISELGDLKEALEILEKMKVVEGEK